MWFKNLFNKRKYTTGCIPDLPDERDFVVESILETEVILPDNYVVPYYRHWFDSNFNVIPSEVQIKFQNGFGSCVNQATSRQKESQEGMELSARDLHIYCKAHDNLSYTEGTFLRTAQNGLVDVGIAEEKLYPEVHKPEITFEQYIDESLVPENVRYNRELHKSESYFSVNGFDKIRDTLYQRGVPVVTSSTWYKGDNNMSPDYIMKMPSGKNVGGHAFCVIGWKTVNGIVYLIVVNSWGNGWGDNGLFYIDEPIASTRLNSGWVTVDIEKDLAKILQKYSNKIVKEINKSNIYLINSGKKQLFPDEFIFWSNGYDFNNVVIIDKEDLDLIPIGEPIAFNYDATYTTKQLKNFVGYLVDNKTLATKFFNKYFK